MASEVLSIRISPEMKAELDNLSQVLNRSKSYIVELAIKEFIENNAWEIKELLDAEKEIEAGDFVPWEEVKKYLESWGQPKTYKMKMPKKPKK